METKCYILCTALGINSKEINDNDEREAETSVYKYTWETSCIKGCFLNKGREASLEKQITNNIIKKLKVRKSWNNIELIENKMLLVCK